MIFTSNILDFLWPNILLTAIYIKNRHFIKTLNSILPYKKLKGKPPLVYHLWALRSTIYSFITKENYIKLGKFAL